MAQPKLKGKEEEIFQMLIEGKTFQQIATHFGVGLSTLHEYINKDEFSVRTRNALQISASSYADKAEQVLLDAEKDKIEIQRARELAQHYRWKAGKRNPKKYGDRIETENHHTGELTITRKVVTKPKEGEH